MVSEDQVLSEPILKDFERDTGIAVKSVFKDPEGYWTGFSARARLLVVNKSAGIKPSGILAYRS